MAVMADDEVSAPVGQRLTPEPAISLGFPRISVGSGRALASEQEQDENQALKYYMHDGPSAFRFELSGDLSSEGARRLEQDWRSASSEIGRRTLNVDMTYVTSADEEGRALLRRSHYHGARLIARSKTTR